LKEHFINDLIAGDDANIIEIVDSTSVPSKNFRHQHPVDAIAQKQ